MAAVKPQPDRKFKPEYYVEAYRLAKAGLPDHEVAKSIGVTGKTFRRWKRKKPAFLKALLDAREKDQGDATLEEYLFDRLTPDLQELWMEIVQFNKRGGGGVVAVQELMKDKGVRVRQHLLLHALCRTKFNPSTAMKLVGISKATYDYWVETDPEFDRLVKEMEWHKGNWYTERFHQLCSEGSEQAILHAMKTYNRSRGYGEKMEIDHTHVHDHTIHHDVVDFDKLATHLSIEAKREIAAAMDKIAQKALPGHVEDAEFTIKDK